MFRTSQEYRNFTSLAIKTLMASIFAALNCTSVKFMKEHPVIFTVSTCARNVQVSECKIKEQHTAAKPYLQKVIIRLTNYDTFLLCHKF